MKNLTKIFVAVALLFTSFACTTDATSDLGVAVEGQTQIVLSLEQSRTQLGEKAGEVYPLYWSDGDKISVNGVESNALSTSGNSAVATFTVPGTLNAPYCIAYPAAPAGQVLFADVQSYAEGTFASGVSTMYAYSESNGGAVLQHLTGVLKIGVSGEKTLSYAQISTADRAPIAGAFTIDFATGEVTATSGAKEIIGYSFGDGLALSSTPQYIHAVVPAGVYDELYVTLYDTEGGVMYATVKAGETKPLNAGSIREFSNTIAYAPNTSIFVIKDKESLNAFAAGAAESNKDALFVADVDMTGESWAPIEGYAGTVNGNGYAIKGLTAPLFGTTSASIKGLHLTEVNIEETQLTYVGALARHIESVGDVTPVVEHCSVSGKVVLNNTTVPYAKPAAGNVTINEYAYIAVAGLVGRAYGVTLSDCVNKAAVEVKQCFPTDTYAAGNKLYPSIAGVLGYGDKSTVTTSIYRLENYGDVSITDALSYTGVTNVSVYSPLMPYIAGVVGTMASANKACVINDLKNYGNVTLSGNLGGGVALGGAIGFIAANDCSHIYNYGKVTAKDCAVRYLYCGGAVSYAGKSHAMTEIHNYGAVTMEESATIGTLVCGGMMGYEGANYAALDATHSYVRNGSNSGPVTVLSNDYADELHDGTGLYYRVGGIAGWTQHNIDNCNNLKGGVVTCKGSLFNCDDSIYSICVGGLVGYKTVNKIHNSRNDADVNISLNIATKEGYDTNNVRLNAGGIAGYTNLPCTDVTNNGAVTCEGQYAGRLILGGIYGVSNTTSGNIPVNENCVNNGAVTVKKGSSVGHYLMFGGVAGYIHKNKNCTNNGAVTIEDEVTWCGANSYIGGAAGYSHGAVENLTNNAPLTLGKDCAHPDGVYEYIGGTLGFLYSDADGLYNTEKGVITIGKSDYTSYVLLGGCLGAAPAWNDGKTAQVNFYIKNCENRGAINYYAIQTTNSTHYLGGVFGYIYEQELNETLISPDVTNVDNYGPIYIGSENLYVLKMGGVASYIGGLSNFVHNHKSGTITLDVTTRSHCHIGGASQVIKDTANDITNDGDITVNGSVGGTVYLGGVITHDHNYHRTRCNNNGNITVNATMGTGSFVGGICYASSSKIYFIDCHNTGNLIYGEKASAVKYLAWGGLVGLYEGGKASVYNVLEGCSNSGDIIIKGNPASAGYCTVGGAYGLLYGKGTIVVDKGFTNSGDIIFEGNHTGAYSATTNITTRRSVDLGGFTGMAITGLVWSSSTYPSWTGNIVNTGTIKYTGKSTSGAHLGGIFGMVEGTAPVVTDGSYINTGEIICTGEYSSAAEPYGIGGIAGVAYKGISNAKSYCKLNALGYPAVGFITGSSRSAECVASNCQVGGSTYGDYNIEDEEYKVVTLDASNYYNYIYGSGEGTDWGSSTDYDGCSLLESNPIAQ